MRDTGFASAYLLMVGTATDLSVPNPECVARTAYPNDGNVNPPDREVVPVIPLPPC